MLLMILTEYLLNWSYAVRLINQFAIQGEPVKMCTVILWSSISSSGVFIHRDREHTKILVFKTNEWVTPTSTSEVAEALKGSQKVSEESNKYSISVTYDLAIAKVPVQLQA